MNELQEKRLRELAAGAAEWITDLPTRSARLQAYHELLGSIHSSLQVQLMEMTDSMKKGDTPMIELADLGFLCREIGVLSDEQRKDAEARMRDASKMLCVLLNREQLLDEDTPDTIKGELASATPKVKMAFQVPRKGSPEYDLLCKHFNIPANMMHLDVIKFSYGGLSDWITELIAEGKPTPAGVARPFEDFQCVYRRRRRQ